MVYAVLMECYCCWAVDSSSTRFTEPLNWCTLVTPVIVSLANQLRNVHVAVTHVLRLWHLTTWFGLSKLFVDILDDNVLLILPKIHSWLFNGQSRCLIFTVMFSSLQQNLLSMWSRVQNQRQWKLCTQRRMHFSLGTFTQTQRYPGSHVVVSGILLQT